MNKIYDVGFGEHWVYLRVKTFTGGFVLSYIFY